jgi:hypothetical protein
MNSIGKILVVLNFIFAVLVGGFLVVDFATRTNWKTVYDENKRQLSIAQSERDTYASEAAEARTKLKDRDLEVVKVTSDLNDQKQLAMVNEQKLQDDVTAAQNLAKNTDLKLQKTISDVERLKVVELDLRKTIKDREQAILALQDDVKKYRNEALANEQVAKSLADRNQELLAQVQELSVKLNRMIAGGPGGATDTIVAKTGNEPNPPSTLVKGQIERVDPSDNTLVQISLGTDQGVKNGNTLEIFRTQPQPKYLGMVRIVDASHNRSVGRLILTKGAVNPQLRAGDQAWSWLSK